MIFHSYVSLPEGTLSYVRFLNHHTSSRTMASHGRFAIQFDQLTHQFWSAVSENVDGKIGVVVGGVF